MQYIACRSGSVVPRADLNKMLTHVDSAKRAMFWPYGEFAAIDRLMEGRG